MTTSENPQDAKLENPKEAKLSATASFNDAYTQAQAEAARCGAPQPAPKLNGFLIKQLDQPPIYLILNGYRRHIVTGTTMRRLFTGDPYDHVTNVIDAEVIAKGPDIAVKAKLVKGEDSDPWYLLPGGQVKMWIKSPAIHNLYHFRAVEEEAQILIDSIPDGPDVQGRP